MPNENKMHNTNSSGEGKTAEYNNPKPKNKLNM